MTNSMNKPELETLDYKPTNTPEEAIDKLFPEQPNLKIIEEIEGLMSQVNDKLYSLMPNDLTVYNENIGKKRVICAQAAEDIDLFQKTTLFDLRREFE